jgi:CubicO group peptidase (beta-lactamase class C family)
MKRREFLYASGLSVIAPAIAGRTQSDGRFDELCKLVETKMTEYHIPGVSYGVLKNGTRMTRSFGVTSLEDPQPVTPDTIFPIASISKTFATTAVMRLIDQGKVELKTPIQKYLPDFRVQDDTTSHQVSLWHLVTHTPGWEGQIPAQDRGLDSLNFFVQGMKDNPQISRPGTVWSYNNAGFNVAGRVIEVVTGKSIHDALRDLIYSALGMKRATTLTGDAMTYRFAMPHRQRPQTGQTDVIHNFSLPADVTAGGIATTLNDLLSYAEFHLGDGNANGQRVLPRPALDQMKTAQLKKNSTEDEIGLGWHIRHLGSVSTFAHGGTLSGHTLHIQLVPERSLAFVILTNHSDGWRLIQEVERATLKSYESLALSPNQKIAHRGVSERMDSHAQPMADQPALEQYVGTYQRPPLGKIEVRSDAGKLVVANGNNPTGSSLVFYGPDVAYAIAGQAYVGTPYEFVRTPDRKVGWIRINGRVARKDGVAL